MCGRYTLKTVPDQWGQLLLPLIDVATVNQSWHPRYNIAPTQQVLAVACGEQPAGVPISAGLLPETGAEEQISFATAKGRWAHYFRWGLIPAWAADLAIGNSMINARSESLHEKRSFKGPLGKRRCLIVADGYYEWQLGMDCKKHPFWITPAHGGVIHFAGLWEVNSKAKGRPVTSCTIITTAASPDLKHLHDRMPVVFDALEAERWLDLTCEADEAQALLGPADEGYFAPQEVSTYVNNPRHEDAACIEPPQGS